IVSTEQMFAQVNHPQIISSIRQELASQGTGGSMQIRLDPPELGALQVTIQMRDGAITAAFQTSNDDATRLLSHSLNQLKQTLESQGVVVDRMQVQQQQPAAGRDSGDYQSRDDGQQRNGSFAEQQSARQEQERRELMQ